MQFCSFVGAVLGDMKLKICVRVGRFRWWLWE